MRPAFWSGTPPKISVEDKDQIRVHARPHACMCPCPRPFRVRACVIVLEGAISRERTRSHFQSPRFRLAIHLR